MGVKLGLHPKGKYSLRAFKKRELKSLSTDQRRRK
jgi:hypothetical protein